MFARLVLTLIIFWPALAAAHEIRPTIATLSFDEQRAFTLMLDTNAEALLADIGPGHEDTNEAPNADYYNTLRDLRPAELEERIRAFLPNLTGDGPLVVDGAAVPLKILSIEVPPVGNVEQARDTVMTFTGSLPANASTFGWVFSRLYGMSVLRVERPGEEVEGQLFAAGQTEAALPVGIASNHAWWQTAWDYVYSGFDHIIPKGLDHILFVLGIFFLAPRLKPLLWQVTAFTFAHTITLALGLYGIINLSPAIVEPIIALSIVYVAVENIVTKELHPWRPAVVFIFGLLHGLGFAGVLAEFGLPEGQIALALVSFNIGVELGQLTVIAIAAALLFWAFNKPWYRKAIAIPASVAIGLMGAYWFLERTVL
jgi:hypothetical protein